MATTKNIAITINNGTDYDTLYPTVNLANYTGTLPLTATTGTLAVSRGGTGGTTGAAGLYNLVNPCGALTNTGVATGDYFPMLDTSATTGKKITLANLTTYLSGQISGSVKTASGSYTGTGVIPTVRTSYKTFTLGFKPCLFYLTNADALMDGGGSSRMLKLEDTYSATRIMFTESFWCYKTPGDTSTSGGAYYCYGDDDDSGYCVVSNGVVFSSTTFALYYGGMAKNTGGTTATARALFNANGDVYYWWCLGV